MMWTHVLLRTDSPYLYTEILRAAHRQRFWIWSRKQGRYKGLKLQCTLLRLEEYVLVRVTFSLALRL